MPRLHRARVESDIQIENRESIFAVSRKIVSELQPAASAERNTIDVSALVALRQRISRARLLRYWLTHSEFRGEARSANVLIDKRRRHAESCRDILEAAYFD